MARPIQQLWRFIPLRDDLRGQQTLRTAVGATEPKIGKFDDPLSVDEDIAWLDVTVEEIRAVQVGETGHNLQHEPLDRSFRYGEGLILNDGFQVGPAVLIEKDKCGLVMDDPPQRHHIRVFCFLQRFHFANGGEIDTIRTMQSELYLLPRELLACILVSIQFYHPKLPFPKCPHLLIGVHPFLSTPLPITFHYIPFYTLLHP
mmetsp:Transcript_10617/g.29766  ORF Transcript_10617/g.29766 Transcript_10617/m.29766 type:complete len:202 (-) Transcript_10617:25-630(-)